jgi:outer membrane protein insertion porin family
VGRRVVLLLTALLLFTAVALAQQGIIEDIRVHGNRRIPLDTIKARMFSRVGDVYEQTAIERDFSSLWNTGYFDDLRFVREESPKGWVLHVYLKEKPTIREIKYVGLSSLTQSEILDKFKELKVGLSQESQFDPTRVKKAEVVLKNMLASHGRQYAVIRTEVRPLPPAAVGVTFVVKEGPKVKVGRIKFEGNKKTSTRYLRASMKNLRPLGIPRSIVLENLLSRTYDATKLDEDAERIRFALQDKGYYKAVVEDPVATTRDTHPVVWYNPAKRSNGKVVDLKIHIEEGERYRLKAITFSGNKALSNNTYLRRVFKIKDGDYFNRTVIGKGLEDLKKVYGAQGYINFTAVPGQPEVDEAKREVTIPLDIDEGKPFYVRRIEFEGNTTTRDKVIRRELALEEGGVYNSQLWEMSLMRLNQLSYFEALKPEQDSEVHQNLADQTVDITLKVKEKGKNSIGMTGGISGVSGAFIGVNYETNNFLGLGETFSVGGNLGSYQRDFTFGFTEPYFKDKPLQLGAQFYMRKFTYNQLKQAEISSGQKEYLPSDYLNSLQNYSTNSVGFTVSANYPMRRSRKRLGLGYSFDVTNVVTYSDASKQYFEYLEFRGVSGPAALNGIITSKVIPTFSVSTIDYPQRPHFGSSFNAAAEIAGLGGNVNTLRPFVEYKRFIPMKGIIPVKDPSRGRQTLGIRLQSSFITGFGGKAAPPNERSYMGGDTDLRGFDQRAISPVAYLPNAVNLALTNPDGSTVPLDPNNLRRGTWKVPLPVWSLVYPGGDTSEVANVEYRVPIAGSVTLAAFMDVGWNMALRLSQLRIANMQMATLSNTVYGCATVNSSSLECVPTANIQGFNTNIDPYIRPLSGTNGIARMSTGLELQMTLPVINAPFRIYYAFNPLRMDTVVQPGNQITRSLFPDNAAGTYTYQQALATYGGRYKLYEPSCTFRFSVATTF